MNAAKKLLLTMGSAGLPLYVSDGFSAYPITDGNGNPDLGYRRISGANKTWGTGYGTWGAAAGSMASSALVGGTAINTADAGSPNARTAIQVPTYTAGWAGVVVRYVNNYNFIFGYWDGSLMRLRKIVNNAGTGLIAAAGSFAAGSVISVRADLTSVSLWLDGVQIGTTQTISDVALLSSTFHGAITSNTGNTFDNANVYPLGTTPVVNIYAYGDSKTGTTGDNEVPMNGYPPRMSTALLQVVERPARSTVGGATVASRAGTIAADLAATAGTPDFVLSNLGANDVASLPAEATWKANYQTIISAMAARWGKPIFLVRPWRRGYATECDSLAAWIADLVTSNPGAVFAGADERTVLEGGDDGATYTADGIHPNSAGYTVTAAAHNAAIGI